MMTTRRISPMMTRLESMKLLLIMIITISLENPTKTKTTMALMKAR
jgi:hypothetical protein